MKIDSFCGLLGKSSLWPSDDCSLERLLARLQRILLGRLLLPQHHPFFFFINLFIYLFLAELGLCCCMRPSGGYSSLRCAGFSLLWLLLLRSTGSRHAGFSSCASWALGARASLVVARGLSSCVSQALECRLSTCSARA